MSSFGSGNYEPTLWDRIKQWLEPDMLVFELLAGSLFLCALTMLIGVLNDC